MTNKLSLYENIPAIENNFTVKFRVYASEKNLIPHWHEHIEMLYFTGGECDFICNGKAFEARRGDLVVVNSTEIHSFVPKGQVKYYCLLVYPEFFSDIRPIDTPIMNRVSGDERIGRIMDEIHREYTDDADCSDMVIKGLLYTLLAHLYREYPYTEEHKIDVKARTSMLERLDRVIAYITANYSERITTAELAELCYLSESHFCRFFKRAVGKTVTQYVNEYRVSKAAVLLSGSGGTVSEIAAAVGFSDLNYFCRVFRSVMGVTPTEYREGKR